MRCTCHACHTVFLDVLLHSAYYIPAGHVKSSVLAAAAASMLAYGTLTWEADVRSVRVSNRAECGVRPSTGRIGRNLTHARQLA